MTPDQFRAWRRRHGLSRLALLAALHRVGWTDLTLSALDNWVKRGPSQCGVVVLGFMERHRAEWDVQRTSAIASPESETAPE